MNKLHQNQKGFSHILLMLAGVAVLAVAGFAATRVMKNSKSDSGQSNTVSQQATDRTASDDETDVQLQNFGLASLDSVAISKNVLREFESKGMKGFYIFGDKLEGGRTNPNFEFASLQEGTEVISAIDGVVAFIEEQADSSDYEVFLQPKENSLWTIGYDHLINLKVKKGDIVKAGDVLGNPQRQGNGALRFEIQINKGQNDDSMHICPTTLLAIGVKQKVQDELKTMLESWEVQTGYELYDIDAQQPIGCTKPSLSPAEAEGR